MALELTYTHELGFNMENVYAKITNVSFENSITNLSEVISVHYRVDLVKNENARKRVSDGGEGESPFFGRTYIMSLDKATTDNQYNLLKQCYINLKTQTGFSGAIDK